MLPRRTRRAAAGSPVRSGAGVRPEKVEEEQEEEGELPDQGPGAAKMTDTSATKGEAAFEMDSFAEPEVGDEGVTRCVCGSMGEFQPLSATC